MQFERLAIAHHATPQMPGVANKNVKNLKLRGPSKVDNKSLAAGALTARTNQSSDSADNGVNLEVSLYLCSLQYSSKSICLQAFVTCV